MTRITGGQTGPMELPEDPRGVEISQLRGELNALARALRAERDGDGEVHVADLEERIEATGDPALRSELDEIIAQFPRTVRRTYSAGCGGGRTTRTTTEDPKILTRDQVQRALADIAAAKASAKELDADGDGVLTEAELDAGGGSEGLAQGLLEASLREALAAQEAEEPEAPAPERSAPERTYRAGCG